MKQSRRRHGRAFKPKVALAALRGDQTIDVPVFSDGTNRPRYSSLLLKGRREELGGGATEMNTRMRITTSLAVSLLLLAIIACAETPASPTPARTEAAVGVQPTQEPTPASPAPARTEAAVGVQPTQELNPRGGPLPPPTPTLEERRIQTPTNFGYNTRVVDGDIHVWHRPHCPPVPPAIFVASVILTDLRSGSHLHLNRDGSVKNRSDEGRERFAAVLEDSSLMELILTPFECPKFDDRDDDAGPFKSVSAGYEHTCGVRRDGSVACWGSNRSHPIGNIVGQATPPGGSFDSVSAGFEHTCGVRSDSFVACWGTASWGRATPPEGSFDSVSAGTGHTCGVRSDGSVACWGKDNYGQATPPEGSFDSVSAGSNHTCGVRSDGSVACWGKDNYGQATPPAGSFDSVSAGVDYVCGVRSDGSVACWGKGYTGRATPPEGSFDSVSAGRGLTCGVRSDGSVACWGSDYADTKATPPPGGSFDSVSVGGTHTCGVRSDGSVACWGYNHVGQATPPGE